MRRNSEIRRLIKESGLKHWEIAEVLNMRADKFCVLLRYPLAEEMNNEITSAIQIAKDNLSNKGGTTTNV